MTFMAGLLLWLNLRGNVDFSFRPPSQPSYHLLNYGFPFVACTEVRDLKEVFVHQNKTLLQREWYIWSLLGDVLVFGLVISICGFSVERFVFKN